MLRAFLWCPAPALSHCAALAWACDHLHIALQFRHCMLQASHPQMRPAPSVHAPCAPTHQTSLPVP